MKDYPYIQCLNPRHILNRYTGNVVLVECGKCESCLLKKSLARVTRCKLESSVHKYHLFVTLTFANEYLPCARLIQNDTFNHLGESYDVIRESDGLCLGSVVFKDNLQKNQLVKKCNAGFNRIPILDSSYPQKFLKRLRKRIKNEKVRTFYCGEYGPIHFRPHYHLSLWFDEEETFQVIGQAILESWSFGRVDYSLSFGKSSSYIASYVNSSMYLPNVLKLPSTKPFSNHSVYLGEKFLTCPIQEIQKTDYQSIIRKRICYNGINTDVILWRSLKSRIFPKLKGFATQSEHERVLSYSVYAIIRDWTKETSPICQARFIADYVRYYDFYHEESIINDMLQMMRSWLNYYAYDENENLVYVKPFLTDYDKFERIVYSHVLASRHFLKTICQGNDSYNNVKYKLQWIDEFYKYLDSDSLKKQLDLESKLHKVKDADSVFFFHNTLSTERLKENKLFKRFYSAKVDMFKNYVKHKELNDLNKTFNY